MTEHEELLAIHAICMNVANCPEEEEGDTLTVKMVKRIAIFASMAPIKDINTVTDVLQLAVDTRLYNLEKGLKMKNTRCGGVYVKHSLPCPKDAEIKRLEQLEKQYCERLGRLAQLCDEVIPWVILQDNAPFRIKSPADEIMEYVESVRP